MDEWQPKCAAPEGLVVPAALDPKGVDGPTRGSAQHGRWRRTTKGFYVPSETDSSRVEQRILEQSMRLGGRGAVTGWAALRLWGAGFCDGLAQDGKTVLPVLLNTRGTQLRPTAESVPTRAVLDASEVVLRHDIRCTTIHRALLDEMTRLGDVRAATVAVSMVAAAELTSIRRMRAYVESRVIRTGHSMLLEALDLAHEHCASPAEARMLLVWELDAGFDTPLANRHVWSLDGELLGIPDLLDVAAGVVGEYDGAHHRDRARHRRDVARTELFLKHGLEQFVVVAGDSDEVTVERMRAARERAARRPTSERSWTIDPPPWVMPERSLDERLDFADFLREQSESYRDHLHRAG